MIELFFIWLAGSFLVIIGLLAIATVFLGGSIGQRLLGVACGLIFVYIGLSGVVNMTDSHYDKVACYEAGYTWENSKCYSELVEVTP